MANATTISKIRSLSDIEECVNLYYNLNDHSFIAVSKEESIRRLSQKVRQQKFVRTLLDDNDKIVAWIYCDIAKPDHSTEPQFQQMYYASNLIGIQAYKAVIKLHEAMIEESKRLKVNLLVSYGSHMDESYTFTRILEKNGWSRRGYVAVYKLNSI